MDPMSLQIPPEVTRAWEALDAKVSDAVFAGLGKVGLPIKEWGQSPATAHLPFVASPTPLLVWIAVYLTVVLSGLATGSLFSKPQEKKPDPFWLKAFVQMHNVFLIALSSYMFGGAIYEAYSNGYNFWGNAYNEKQTGMAFVIYVFYMSKWYEFFDTVSSPGTSLSALYPPNSALPEGSALCCSKLLRWMLIATVGSTGG